MSERLVPHPDSGPHWVASLRELAGAAAPTRPRKPRPAASPSLPWPRRQCKRPEGPGGRCRAGPQSGNKPPSRPASRAPGCRLQEKGRECAVSRRPKGVPRPCGGTGWGTGDRGPYRSSGAGAGGRATWLECCAAASGLPASGALAPRHPLVPRGLGDFPVRRPRGIPAGCGSGRAFSVQRQPGRPRPRPRRPRPHARVPAPRARPGRAPQVSVAAAAAEQRRQQAPRNGPRLGLCKPRSHA